MNEEGDFCPGVFPTCAEEFWEALDEAMEHEPGLDVQEFCIRAGHFYRLVDPDHNLKFV